MLSQSTPKPNKAQAYVSPSFHVLFYSFINFRNSRLGYIVHGSYPCVDFTFFYFSCLQVPVLLASESSQGLFRAVCPQQPLKAPSVSSVERAPARAAGADPTPCICPWDPGSGGQGCVLGRTNSPGSEGPRGQDRVLNSQRQADCVVSVD